MSSKRSTNRLTMKQLEIELNDAQSSMLSARLNREFYRRCNSEIIYHKIEEAATVQELEEIAGQYGFCDVIDLSPFTTYSARKIMRILTRAIYQFPRIVGRVNYVGSYKGYEELLRKMAEGDGECVRLLGLQHILGPENAKSFGMFGLELCKKLWEDANISLAAFASLGGYCNGLLFDSTDYKDYAYLDTVATLRRNEQNGFHPKGCNTFESVAYHEIGHILDAVCHFTSSEAGKKFLEQYSSEEVESGLSRYALTSPEELVAESISEVFSSSTPRKIASEVYDKLCEFYRHIV